jgi:CelD/BcsL family acetyltransferase involved in cellulose biosynthesis
MRELRVREITSIAELRAQSAAWDDLWRRSASTRPTAQAEQLAIWQEAFAPERPFSAIVVEDEQRLVAALPFSRSGRYGLSIAETLGNAWTPGGELLLDRDCDLEATCRLLLSGLRQRAPGLMKLDGLLLNSIGCRSLLATTQSLRLPQLTRTRFQVPLLQVRGDWQGYLASRSKNHRHQLRNIARRAEDLGGVTLRRHEEISPAEVEPLLRECFQLEAAGWKGRAGGAVLNDPTARQYFVRQAQQLAANWQLAIATLRLEGRLIAFEYGWRSRGVRGVLKIGYDEAFGRLSPGQLLRARLLEQLFAEQSVGWVDFLGPANAATSVWATHRYEVGKTIASLDSTVGRIALAGAGLARIWQGRKWLQPQRPASKDMLETLPHEVPAPREIMPEPTTGAACRLS